MTQTNVGRHGEYRDFVFYVFLWIGKGENTACVISSVALREFPPCSPPAISPLLLFMSFSFATSFLEALYTHSLSGLPLNPLFLAIQGLTDYNVIYRFSKTQYFLKFEASHIRRKQGAKNRAGNNPLKTCPYDIR